MVKKEFVSGVFFTAISKYSSIVISLVISAILARLLTPADFGVISIATVILTFFAIFSDLGIAPAIVQNKELSKCDLDNIYSFTFYLGTVVSLLFFLLAPLLAKFYEVDSLVNICRLLSVNLFFSSINIVPNALLLKDKRFRFIAVRVVAVQAIFGIIAVVAALVGFGIHSLLIAPIGSSILIFIVNYIQNPLKFAFKISRKSIDMISSFSLYQFLFSCINYFSRNLDNLLIGKYIGVVDLGYYDKSYRLMMLPLGNIPHVITPVLHPIFSEHQNNRDYIFNAYLRLLSLLAYVGFPLSVFLFFEASNLINIVFGEQWGESVPIFRILAISVAPQILASTLGSIFQSANETKKLFKIGVFTTITNVGAIVAAIMVFGTLNALSSFICFTFYFNFLVSFAYIFNTVFSKSIILLLRKLRNPFLLSIGLIPLCYYLENLKLQPFVSLVFSFLMVVVISFFFIQLSKDYDLVELFKKKFIK